MLIKINISFLAATLVKKFVNNEINLVWPNYKFAGHAPSNKTGRGLYFNEPDQLPQTRKVCLARETGSVIISPKAIL